MQNKCNVRVHNDVTLFSSPLSFFGPLRNKHDLLQKLQKQALPIEISMEAHCQVYPCIFNDLKQMEKEGLLYLRCSSHMKI